MEPIMLVIEGLDGSGKATQTQKLMERLEQLHKKAVKVSFPNYEDDSSALVKMYLKGDLGQAEEVNAYAASLFYTVDRYATFRKAYQDKWEQGYAIIADRYTTSNMYHQCTKEAKENWDSYLDWLEDLEYKKVGLPKPSQVIYLDVEPEVSRELLSKRYEGDESKKDIHEANFAYLLHCREAALYAANKFGWKVICCNEGKEMRSVEDISDEIWEAVKGYWLDNSKIS